LQLFDFIDEDKSENISADEVEGLMNLLGVSMSRAQIESMIAEVDEDKSGAIDFEEFLQASYH
jgi:Ca2+-binding EF-hand superfamily protein